jgi:hypothetical protein
MKTTLRSTLLVAALACLPRAASAHHFTGDNELGGMIGGQAGLHDGPGGAGLFTEYGHYLSGIAWLNLQLNFAFGGDDGCYLDRGGFVYCGSWGGEMVEWIAGVKLKFRTHNERLVPYMKVGGGIDFIFLPGQGDDGVGFVFRAGGGVKYYVSPSVALGGEIDLGVGPGVFGCGYQCSTTGMYSTLALMGGVEWNF